MATNLGIERFHEQLETPRLHVRDGRIEVDALIEERHRSLLLIPERFLDREATTQPFEPIAIRCVDEAIGAQRVSIEERGAAARRPWDRCTVAGGQADDCLGLLGGEQIGRIVVTVTCEAARDETVDRAGDLVE